MRGQIALTLDAIAKAVDGRLTGADRPVGGFSIDTRTLKPGDLFFAIPGERFVLLVQQRCLCWRGPGCNELLRS